MCLFRCIYFLQNLWFKKNWGERHKSLCINNLLNQLPKPNINIKLPASQGKQLLLLHSIHLFPPSVAFQLDILEDITWIDISASLVIQSSGNPRGMWDEIFLQYLLEDYWVSCGQVPLHAVVNGMNYCVWLGHSWSHQMQVASDYKWSNYSGKLFRMPLTSSLLLALPPSKTVTDTSCNDLLSASLMLPYCAHVLPSGPVFTLTL